MPSVGPSSFTVTPRPLPTLSASKATAKCLRLQLITHRKKCCRAFVLQEVAWYLRRHKQELELLLIGSKTMGAEFTEGVSKWGGGTSFQDRP